jgi:hypothetical protein
MDVRVLKPPHIQGGVVPHLVNSVGNRDPGSTGFQVLFCWAAILGDPGLRRMDACAQAQDGGTGSSRAKVWRILPQHSQVISSKPGRPAMMMPPRYWVIRPCIWSVRSTVLTVER